MGRDQSAVAWSAGVLRVQDAPVSNSKPRVLGESPVDFQVASAVGYEDAPKYFQLLEPMWRGLLRALGRHRRVRLFLKDFRTAEDQTWAPIEPLLSSGALGGPPLQASYTQRPGLCTMELDANDLGLLTGQWWPSGLGTLAVVVLAGPSASDISSDIGTSGWIGADSLDGIVHYAETSASFDQLGLEVISWGTTWQEIEAKLKAVGWIDGKPVEEVLDTLNRRGFAIDL